MGDIVSFKCDDNFKQLFLNEEVRRYFISDALGIPVEEIGSVPEDLRIRIRTERDPETLDRWLLIAAKIESIESFQEKAGI